MILRWPSLSSRRFSGFRSLWSKSYCNKSNIFFRFFNLTYRWLRGSGDIQEQRQSRRNRRGSLLLGSCPLWENEDYHDDDHNDGHDDDDHHDHDDDHNDGHDDDQQNGNDKIEEGLCCREVARPFAMMIIIVRTMMMITIHRGWRPWWLLGMIKMTIEKWSYPPFCKCG